MARRRPPTVHGMVLVDKPPALTSHDVVAVLRRRFNERRIGHAGTLDPDATGLLVVGVGSGTRLLRFATAGTKTYECLIHFGVETDTGDSSGRVIARHQVAEGVASHGVADVKAAAARFVGDISQIPPMFSAVKVGGQRLHRLARAGLEVEREPRVVTVESFDLTTTDDPLTYRAVVRCGAGTYVRTLAVDLGRALGVGAHISNLRRTASGDFSVTEAQPLNPTEAQPLDPTEALVLRPVTELVRWMDVVHLTPTETERVRHGGVLTADRFATTTAADDTAGRAATTTAADDTAGCVATTAGPWALLDAQGSLVAVHEKLDDGVIRPAVVLANNQCPPTPAS